MSKALELRKFLNKSNLKEPGANYKQEIISGDNHSRDNHSGDSQLFPETLLTSILSGKWHDLTWPRKGSKFKLRDVP